MPPRREIWRAVSRLLPRRAAQYGISVQCAEPVAGSSSTPCAGAKKARDEVVFAAGRGGDDNGEAVEARERREIGRERGNVRGRVIDGEIVAGGEDRRRRAAERGVEALRRRAGEGGARREIEREKIAVAADGERSGLLGAERDPPQP